MQQVHTSEDHNTEPSEIIQLEKEVFGEVIDECNITDCDDPLIDSQSQNVKMVLVDIFSPQNSGYKYCGS